MFVPFIEGSDKRWRRLGGEAEGCLGSGGHKHSSVGVLYGYSGGSDKRRRVLEGEAQERLRSGGRDDSLVVMLLGGGEGSDGNWKPLGGEAEKGEGCWGSEGHKHSLEGAGKVILLP